MGEKEGAAGEAVGEENVEVSEVVAVEEVEEGVEEGVAEVAEVAEVLEAAGLGVVDSGEVRLMIHQAFQYFSFKSGRESRTQHMVGGGSCTRAH